MKLTRRKALEMLAITAATTAVSEMAEPSAVAQSAGGPVTLNCLGNEAPQLAKKAWSLVRVPTYATTHFDPPAVLHPLDETPGLSTNSVSQSCLEAMEVLELCGDLYETFCLPIAITIYVFGANSAPPRTRSFHIEYKATIPAAKVELWMPLPHDDDYQKIESIYIESPYTYNVATGTLGNGMLHMVKPETRGPSTVTVSLDVLHREHLQSRLSSGERLAKDEDAAELAKYLKPDRLVPLDPQIRTWAREVVDGAHAPPILR